MNSKTIYDISSSIFDKLCVVTFLILFINASLIIKYIDIEKISASTIELCEDEEGEEKEVNEEIDEEFYEFRTSFLGFRDNELIYHKKVRNISILIAYHIDVFTPPPELT